MGRAIVNDPASCSIHFQHNAFIATLAQWLPTSTVSTCWRDIVNLFVEMGCIVGLKRGKALESNERLGKRWSYAACFTPVISFHT